MSTKETTDRNTELLLMLINAKGNCGKIIELTKCSNCPIDAEIHKRNHAPTYQCAPSIVLNIAKDLLIYSQNLKIEK